MDLGVFAPILEGFYTDEVTIYRYITFTDTDGATQYELSETPVYSSVPCRISFPGMENPKDVTIDSVPLSYSPKLFLSPTIKVLPGDFVVIKRLDGKGKTLKMYRGELGQSNMFPSHQEVRFNYKEDA